MYVFLDKFFFVFHSSLIILFGWAWKKTRLVNLAVILLTALSWFVLGIWYGYGYCPSTDWHWQVRAQLGIRDLPGSYTKFLVDSFTGWNVDQKTVDVFTLILLIVALTASLSANIRAWRKKRASLNFPGYHFHFIDQAGTAGGHLLEVRISKAKVEVDPCHSFSLALPDGGDFYRLDLSKDKQQELKSVQGRSGSN